MGDALALAYDDDANDKLSKYSLSLLSRAVQRA